MSDPDQNFSNGSDPDPDAHSDPQRRFQWIDILWPGGFINFNQIDKVSNLGLYNLALRSEREEYRGKLSIKQRLRKKERERQKRRIASDKEGVRRKKENIESKRNREREIQTKQIIYKAAIHTIY